MSTEQVSQEQQIPPAGEDSSSHARADEQVPTAPVGVIWTPRFIIIFALLLVLGLSLASLLTQGWLNGYYSGQWVFQTQVLLVSLGWLALLVVTSSRWLRLASIFGLAWTFFMTVNILIQSMLADSALLQLSHVNAATCLLFLGCYLCLALDRVSFTRWDAWLLGLLPLIGITAAALEFLLLGDHSFTGLEESIATIALVLSMLVWWLRPSCWTAEPAPTLLFGLVPFILLILNLASNGYNALNFFLTRVIRDPHSVDQANFFFSQVVLLCLALGIARLAQGERTRPRDSASRH